MRAREGPLEVRCSPVDWASVTAWQKLLLGLSVSLVVPLLALSGVALPVPAAVYRAAVALVEGAQDRTEAVGREERVAPSPDARLPRPRHERSGGAVTRQSTRVPSARQVGHKGLSAPPGAQREMTRAPRVAAATRTSATPEAEVAPKPAPVRPGATGPPPLEPSRRHVPAQIEPRAADPVALEPPSPPSPPPATQPVTAVVEDIVATVEGPLADVPVPELPLPQPARAPLLRTSAAKSS